MRGAGPAPCADAVRVPHRAAGERGDLRHHPPGARRGGRRRGGAGADHRARGHAGGAGRADRAGGHALLRRPAERGDPVPVLAGLRGRDELRGAHRAAAGYDPRAGRGRGRAALCRLPGADPLFPPLFLYLCAVRAGRDPGGGRDLCAHPGGKGPGRPGARGSPFAPGAGDAGHERLRNRALRPRRAGERLHVRQRVRPHGLGLRRVGARPRAVPGLCERHDVGAPAPGHPVHLPLRRGDQRERNRVPCVERRVHRGGLGAPGRHLGRPGRGAGDALPRLFQPRCRPDEREPRALAGLRPCGHAGLCDAGLELLRAGGHLCPGGRGRQGPAGRLAGRGPLPRGYGAQRPVRHACAVPGRRGQPAGHPL